MSVWMLPLPFFSHVLGLSQLGTRLARHGLTVRLFLTKNDRDRVVDHPLFASWSADGLDVEITVMEDCQSAVPADTSGNAGRFVESFFSAEITFGTVLARAAGDGSLPTCVVVDYCAPRATEAALKLGIFSCVFYPASASNLSARLYLLRSMSTGLVTLPSIWTDERAEELVSVPGYELMKVYDLSEALFRHHPFYDVMTAMAVPVMEKADIVLINTFRDLEPRAFSALQQSLNAASARNSTKAPPVWAVGPTFAVPYTSRQLPENGFADPFIQFLNSHPTSSVVYVSFGGDVNLPEEQIRELIYGLENTQHPFICVLHAPKRSDPSAPVRDAKSVVPEACLSRIANRSLFVKWAPQQQVLSHPSTGAFISHVGFNSILEAVAMGVPIIAWPCMYDQRMNSRLLVDVAQLSIEVSPGRSREALVDRKEVERCVNFVLHSEGGAALRRKVQAMKEKAEAAVGTQGDSTCNIQALVARIRERVTAEMPSSKTALNGVTGHEG